MKIKRICRSILAVAVSLALMGGAVGLYASDYYRANQVAVEAMMNGGTVLVDEIEDGVTVFAPQEARTGFVFYPGGKVEYTAYAPLLRALAEQNILCVLLKMPLNLAVLDIDAASGIQEQFPEIDIWYIGGHSLGGSMAASYLSKHTEDYDGMILLASYSTVDLSGTELEVASIYGSADGVLNLEKYKQYRSNLPDDTLEYAIEGGNHAQFGSYGHQEGDGAAEITAEEQIEQTITVVTELMFNGK